DRAAELDATDLVEHMLNLPRGTPNPPRASAREDELLLFQLEEQRLEKLPFAPEHGRKFIESHGDSLLLTSTDLSVARYCLPIGSEGQDVMTPINPTVTIFTPQISHLLGVSAGAPNSGTPMCGVWSRSQDGLGRIGH